MWELIIELEENEDVYFCYVFRTLGQLMEFVKRNDEHISDYCRYHIERIYQQED